MQVLIMRHGDAATEATRDALRPLTDLGSQQSAQMADWLHAKGYRIEHVLVSPYLRAKQTLTAVEAHLTLPRTIPSMIETMEQLTPSGDPKQVADYLRLLATQGCSTVLIISHLPLVGYLVSELCPAEMPPMFATAAVAHITLSHQGQHGVLDWQISPANLATKKARKKGK